MGDIKVQKEVRLASQNGDITLRLETSETDSIRGRARMLETAATTNADNWPVPTLIELAEAGLAFGTVRAFEVDSKGTTLEASITRYKNINAPEIDVRCDLAFKGDARAHWETSFYHQDTRFAAVAHTQLIDAAHIIETVAEPQHSHVAKTDSTEEFSAPRANKRKASILDAACTIFARDGYASATVRAIAKEAGTTVPTMYKYFPTKENILENLFDQSLEKMQENIESRIETGRTTEEKLSLAIDAIMENYAKYPRNLMLMYFEHRSLGAKAQDNFRKNSDRYRKIISDILTEGKNQGIFTISDPEIAANIFLSSCTVWPLRNWAVGEYGIGKVTDETRNMILNGLKGSIT